MKFLLPLLLLYTLPGFAQLPEAAAPENTPSAPSHAKWDALLKKYVGADGRVDYRGFQRDSHELNRYLKLLENTPPDPQSWSGNEQMAYWINAYNAFTIQLVIRHYPVESIKDIKGIKGIKGVGDEASGDSIVC